MSTPANTGKDVVYIDIDDEITAIIDKVRSSNEKIVALVLPKRATVFQSIVNMKLLKRTADDAKKHVVLITNEASLLPLAENIGMYVAKNLQTKPEIPELGGTHRHDTEAEELESLSMDDDAEARAGAHHAAGSADLDKTRAIGDLAKGAGAASAVEDAIDFDNTSVHANPLAKAAAKAGAATGTGATAAKSSKGGLGKKLSIPNFNKFRLLLLGGGAALIALIVLLVVCFAVLPSAKVVIKTDSQNVGTNATFTLNTQATTANAQTNVVPAQAAESDKTLTQQASATGQQNNGTKATGTITMSAGACALNIPADVPPGAAVTTSGLTYITQSDVSFVPVRSHGQCVFQGETSSGSTDINIAGQNQGAKYNTTGSVDFTVSGRSDVSANGSTSGGTDNIVQVVQQSDIDGAKAKLAAQDTTAIKQELQSDLQGKGLRAIAETFNAGTPTVTTSANAGDPAANVTVTEKIAYTMLGVSDKDLKQIIKTNVDSQIDTSKQTILDYGLSGASFAIQGAATATSAQVTMQATSVAGSDLNVNSIKQQVAGKKSADAEALIKAYPGVTSVNVTYGPFWVNSVPKQTSKITVQIQKP